ncbi:MAG: hypothetical protein ABI347_08555 [Nitrososphaera sp.]
MRDSIKLPAAVAPSLLLLTIIWITWGQFSHSIFNSSSSLIDNQAERTSIGPILFVVVMGSIVWMMYGVSEHGKFKPLAKLVQRFNPNKVGIDPADNNNNTAQAQQQPQPSEQNNSQLEENLRIIRELKREMQSQEASSVVT